MPSCRRWLRLADAGSVGEFGEFFAADYAGYLAGRIHRDLAELKRLERGFAAAVAESERTIGDLRGSGDKVVLRVTTRATHGAEFDGIPASGRRIQCTGIVIYRFADGARSPGASSTSRDSGAG